jgi:hypothetical protein
MIWNFAGVIESRPKRVRQLAFVAGVLAYFIKPEWMAWSALSVPGWVKDYLLCKA